MVRVKATKKFKYFRNASLKLPKKDFRDLKAGKIVEIDKNKYEQHPQIYEEVKDGDKWSSTR